MTTSPGLADVVSSVHGEVVADQDTSRAAIRRRIVEALPLAPEDLVEDVVAQVVARVDGLGPLEPFLDDPEVTDVLVNGDGRMWVEVNGELSDTGVVCEPEAVLHLVQRIVGPLGVRADRTRPVTEARLEDGSRVHVVLQPVSVDGPCLAIRRFKPVRPTLGSWAGAQVGGLVRDLVHEGASILVSGGTGAGKTTLLGSLTAELAAPSRVITIEDAAELRVSGDHVVRLEGRPPSADGPPEVSVRDLVRAALRLRPDRIIVGELRGAEAFDLLQAMNTGHDGTLTTIHANNPEDALARLETLVLLAGQGLPLGAIREQIHRGVDVVMHVERGPQGRRRLTRIDEVAPEPGGNRTRQLAVGRRIVARPTRTTLRSETS